MTANDMAVASAPVQLAGTVSALAVQIDLIQVRLTRRPSPLAFRTFDARPAGLRRRAGLP